jgi:hypothetical protein
MEYAVVTFSEEGLKEACTDNSVEKDDAFVVHSTKDFKFVLTECQIEKTPITLIWASDVDARTKRDWAYFKGDINKHNKRYEK